MFRLGLISFFLIPFFGIGQEMSLESKSGYYSLDLIIKDSTYTLRGRYNASCVGGSEWEVGTSRVSENKIILNSAKPYDVTNFKRMVLKKRRVCKSRPAYFIGKNGSVWKVTYVENRAFKHRILTLKHEV